MGDQCVTANHYEGAPESQRSFGDVKLYLPLVQDAFGIVLNYCFSATAVSIPLSSPHKTAQLELV